MEEIAPRVFRIISRQLGVYPDQIALASSFYDDIGVDSLDVLEVVMALEDEFGLTIPDEAAGEVKTVEDAVKLVEAWIVTCPPAVPRS